MTTAARPTPPLKPIKPPTTPQAGVLNRPQEHLLLAALMIATTGPAAAATIEDLRRVIHSELTSELDPDSDPATAPAETGELGFDDHHDRDHLTITVGFSSTAYDKLGVTEPPADLTPIPWTALGDAPATPEFGDIAVQICADNAFICEHVLRRIEHSLRDQVQVIWAHTGAQRYNSRPGRTARREGRAWIGFLDGTSNLRPRADDTDTALTFVDPDAAATYPIPVPSDSTSATNPYGAPGTPAPVFPPDLRQHPGHEPAWTRHGTYMAVRVSATDLTSWDNSTLTDQQHTIGRTKKEGTSLDLPAGSGPDAPPAFAADPTNTQVAVNSHVRKSNPRTPGDAARRIFRRGYPLYEGTDSGLRRGLIFIAFGRTLSVQFEFITRGWLNNPDFPFPGAGVDLLKKFDTAVLTGGYYFVPGLTQKNQPWSWTVPTGAAPLPAATPEPAAPSAPDALPTPVDTSPTAPPTPPAAPAAGPPTPPAAPAAGPDTTT